MTDPRPDQRPSLPRAGRSPANERAGRYNRSFAGMIGAMLISLLVIGAFVAFRAAQPRRARRRAPGGRLPRTRWACCRSAGVTVVYPPALPDGWVATSIDFQPGERPAWGVGFLTDDRQLRRSAPGGHRARRAGRDVRRRERHRGRVRRIASESPTRGGSSRTRAATRVSPPRSTGHGCWSTAPPHGPTSKMVESLTTEPVAG